MEPARVASGPGEWPRPIRDLFAGTPEGVIDEGSLTVLLMDGDPKYSMYGPAYCRLGGGDAAFHYIRTKLNLVLYEGTDYEPYYSPDEHTEWWPRGKIGDVYVTGFDVGPVFAVAMDQDGVVYVEYWFN
jgi:hypothetical protein